MKLWLSLRLAVGLVMIMLLLTGGCLHCGWWLVTNQHNISYIHNIYIETLILRRVGLYCIYFPECLKVSKE